ncbi:contractile injection system protein, VgrG/Pvc8 family [Brevundimonas sp. UBA7664]|uniref:contractile injection system protein, VgrG/Pvc8 family n=1 Tax=Brevundimonas sp. UBA7664 TaxID=1946141 RepID=UPI0025C057FD|nr:contractile injection system protein, VgrG/Pvc8 family [Brevundimonas sp. UBA7664]
MTPAFRLVVDGVDISATVKPRLSSLTLTEKRGDEADQLDLVLTDQDGQLKIPPKGARISLALGYVGQLVEKGSFKVDELEWSGAPDILTIKARAADFTADLSTRRDGSWRDTTLGAVLGAVAGRNGLEARIAADLASVALPLVTQSRESDLALIRRLGRENDAVATIKDGNLIFARVGSGRTAGGRDIPSTTLSRRDGDRYTWSSADRDSDQSGSGQSRGVRARWRSVAGATTHTVLVGPARGARRLPRIYASEDASTRAAQAAYDRRARKKATFSLTLALGRPDLYPERRLKLQGFKSMVDEATWLIEEVRHQLGEGLTTDLTLEAV